MDILLVQMRFVAQWTAFGISPDIAENLVRISPATIDWYLKKDKEKLKLKGKTLNKPIDPLKNRIPIRTFYTSEERKHLVSSKSTPYIIAVRLLKDNISIH